jgi:threonine/homoserine/homoserine lactone efflux protein
MIGFLIVAVVVVVAPGPDFALTVRNSITGRVLDVVTGVVLVAFGLRLATERR